MCFATGGESAVRGAAGAGVFRGPGVNYNSFRSAAAVIPFVSWRFLSRARGAKPAQSARGASGGRCVCDAGVNAAVLFPACGPHGHVFRMQVMLQHKPLGLFFCRRAHARVPKNHFLLIRGVAAVVSVVVAGASAAARRAAVFAASGIWPSTLSFCAIGRLFGHSGGFLFFRRCLPCRRRERPDNPRNPRWFCHFVPSSANVVRHHCMLSTKLGIPARPIRLRLLGMLVIIAARSSAKRAGPGEGERRSGCIAADSGGNNIGAAFTPSYATTRCGI